MAKKSKSGRKSAEAKLRDRARTLVMEIDERYWELGRILYEVYDYRAFLAGDGAMHNRRTLFKRWGYKNFGDYCEKGLGIQKRTGENLRFAYYWFAVQQKLPITTINQLVTLGRSKTYLLAGFATASNIMSWINRARACSFEELKRTISTAKNGGAVRPVGSRRSLRVDVCVLVKYLSNIELFLRRNDKKIPADVQDIMKWYEDQAGVRANLKLVA
jgi:hypothetical protein